MSPISNTVVCIEKNRSTKNEKSYLQHSTRFDIMSNAISFSSYKNIISECSLRNLRPQRVKGIVHFEINFFGMF